MQSHKAKKTHELISKHLPHGYAKKVVERAKKKGIDTKQSYVRNVKALLLTNAEIFYIIIELAKETKAIAVAENQKLETLLN